MGLIDKFKNLFTEEVEVEVDEKKEGVQKEVIQVEIPSPKKSRSEIYAKEEPKQADSIDIESSQPKKDEYKLSNWKHMFERRFLQRQKICRKMA